MCQEHRPKVKGTEETDYNATKRVINDSRGCAWCIVCEETRASFGVRSTQVQLPQIVSTFFARNIKETTLYNLHRTKNQKKEKKREGDLCTLWWPSDWQVQVSRNFWVRIEGIWTLLVSQLCVGALLCTQR